MKWSNFLLEEPFKKTAKATLVNDKPQKGGFISLEKQAKAWFNSSKKQDADTKPPPQEQGKTNQAMTAFNIMKTIIGAGIVATPFSLKNSGFVAGLFLIVVVGFIFYWSIMVLVKTSVLAECDTIQKLVKLCFGRFGMWTLNLALFLLTWGSLASYTVYMGDVIPDVLEAIPGVKTSTGIVQFLCSRRGVVIIFSLVALLPVSLFRSLGKLARFSFIGLVSVATIIICVLIVGPQLGEDPETGEYLTGDPGIPLSIINIVGIPSAISVLAFAYVCQQNILLNFYNMQNPTVSRFKPVAFSSIFITMILLIAMGCAYITFRDNSDPNILNNFPMDNTVIRMCKILFALDLAITYPLELFVVRDTLEKQFFGDRPFHRVRHIIMTCCIVASTIIVGVTTCDLGFLLEITGGIAGSFVCFIFPSACWIKVHRIQKKHLIPWAHWGSIGMGCLMIALTFLLMTQKTQPRKCVM